MHFCFPVRRCFRASKETRVAEWDVCFYAPEMNHVTSLQNYRLRKERTGRNCFVVQSSEMSNDSGVESWLQERQSGLGWALEGQ